MTRALALLTVAALGLTGCQADPRDEGADRPAGADPSPMADGPAAEGEPPTGRFYLVAGEQELKADLWEADLATGTYRRLTDHNRVTTIAGCPTMVVVAAAQREVGWTDTLQRLDGDRLVPIDGLGPGTNGTPDLDDDCHMLYDSPVPGTDETVVHRYDPDTGLTTEVASGEFLAGSSWGPNGELLLLERRPDGPVLVVEEPDGRRSEHRGDVVDIGSRHWGEGGWIAAEIRPPPSKELLENPSTATLFVNPQTGERASHRRLAARRLVP